MLTGTRAPRLLDQPGWFAAVMGTGACAVVAYLEPGQTWVLAPIAAALARLWLGMAVLFFVFLVIRSLVVRQLGRGVLAALRSAQTGPAHATFPGAINVLALGLLSVTDLADSPTGRWLILGMAVLGTGLGLMLTVIFFVAAFERDEFEAEEISGTWFIPETVILLGAALFGELSSSIDVSFQRTAGAISFALLGIGLSLFCFTAMLFFNRLVLHRQVEYVGAPAMWIMISPLSVSSLAIQAVAADTTMLGGAWGPAVLQTANFLAAILWGFSLWWVAVATVITVHSGRRALTFTAADWGFVFPSAALALVTLTLGRFWESGFMESLGVLFSFALLGVWLSVFIASVVSLIKELRQPAPAT